MDLEAYTTYIRIERVTLALVALVWVLLPILAARDLVRRPASARVWVGTAMLACSVLAAPLLAHDPEYPWLFGVRARILYTQLASWAFAAAGLLGLVRLLTPTAPDESRPPITRPSLGLGAIVAGLGMIATADARLAAGLSPAFTLALIVSFRRTGNPRIETGARTVSGLLVLALVAGMVASGAPDATTPYRPLPDVWGPIAVLGGVTAMAGLVVSLGGSRGLATLAGLTTIPALANCRPFTVGVPLLANPGVSTLPFDTIDCVVAARAGQQVGPLAHVPAAYGALGRPRSGWTGGQFIVFNGHSECVYTADPDVWLTDLPTEPFGLMLEDGVRWNDVVASTGKRGLFANEILVTQTEDGAFLNTSPRAATERVTNADLQRIVRERTRNGLWAVRLRAAGPDPWTVGEALELCAAFERDSQLFCHLR